MKILVHIAVLAAAALATAASTAGAAATKFTGSELAGQAAVSLAKAQEIALKARAGKIVSQELEAEKGGSGLRYSFDIVSGSKTYEVGVDAKTGQVLENGTETAAQERAEAKAEKAEAKRKSRAAKTERRP
jgi:uncharacterized membrane protein YkoI